MVFRGGALLCAAPHTHRAYDTPFQLGALEGNAARLFQAPQDALPLACTLQAGDVVLACSDGVTDNLFAAEILAHAAGPGAAAAAPQDLALRLAADAHAKAQDRQRDGPFALAAKDADRVWGAGGRLDDITVLVLRLEAGAGPLLDVSEAALVHTPCADAARHLLPVNLALEARQPPAAKAARGV
jgi:hypothetical protein